MKKLLSVVCAFVILACCTCACKAMAEKSADAVWVEGMYRSTATHICDLVLMKYKVYGYITIEDGNVYVTTYMVDTVTPITKDHMLDDCIANRSQSTCEALDNDTYLCTVKYTDRITNESHTLKFDFSFVENGLIVENISTTETSKQETIFAGSYELIEAAKQEINVTEAKTDSDIAETDKDTQIATLNEELAAKNAQIEALNTIVEEKNAQIEDLNAVVADKDLQINELTAAVAEKSTGTVAADLSDMSYAELVKLKVIINNAISSFDNATPEEEIWYNDNNVKITCKKYGILMGSRGVQLKFDFIIENQSENTISAGINNDAANGWAVGTSGNFCDNGLLSGRKMKSTETIYLNDCDVYEFTDLAEYKFVLWVDLDRDSYSDEQLKFEKVITVFPEY